MTKISELNSSTQEKVVELVSKPHRLVLCQVHELERIRLKRSFTASDKSFVNYLFSHYIVKKLPKTYLCP